MSNSKSKNKNIPVNPGIYLMKDNNDKIIYIGKAKNLQKRISNYYKVMNNDPNNSNTDKNFWKTSKLMQKVYDIEYLITDNEIEAFLLESNLIKRYRPLFNIELKDQQRYTYLKITDEKFPRLIVARRNRKGDFYGPKGKVFGPFVYGSSRFLSIGILRKIFKIRICDRLPKKPCLEYFINNCDAPCIDKITVNRYNENIESLKKILDEKKGIQNFLEKMKIQMYNAATKQNYEHAQDIRNTIRIVESLCTKQKIDLKKKIDEEYVGITIDKLNDKAHVLIFKRTRGVIRDRKKFEFDIIGDNNFASFLFQYYAASPKIPVRIYVNEIPESKRNLELALEKIADHKVNIIKISNSFKSRDKKELMDLILRNLHIHIEKKYNPSILDLKDILKLENVPVIIDCFDISNLGITHAVGSCVRFVNGYPYKSGYKKFKIKILNFKQDDYSMIKQIVFRRYCKYDFSLNNSVNGQYETVLNDKYSKLDNMLPNLMVIDGGKGHLNSAAQVIKNMDCDIPMISLAKEKEEIYTQNLDYSIKISKKNPGLQLLQSIRDEAHRFALSYNINMRQIKEK